LGKGSNTTTTQQSGSSTAAPDSNAYQAYLALLNRASGVASTPYQGFQGEETAPINAQQTTGIGDINKFTGDISASGAPISAADIQRYQDPYTNDVINATQADFDTQNKRANSTVTGNAAAQGALGGDRVGVAQALTQEGQARVQAPVIAGLRSSGYQQAVKTAEDQKQQALRAGMGSLQGAGQEVGAGTLQQTTQQAHDTQARQDYYQQQGYPFQVAQWLAAMDTSVGGSMGGTSTSSGNSTTQGPTPNPWTQAAGLGLTAASMFIKDGGAVTGKRAGFASGGSPYGGMGPSWVPVMEPRASSVNVHATMPSAPQAPKQGGLSQDQMKGIGTLAQKGWNAVNDYADPGTAENPLPGLTADDYGSWRGGRIKRYAAGGYADGGTPDFTDRFDAAYPNMAAGVGASKPAYEPQGPTYDDGGGPFRLSSPEDLDEWRGRVDRDNGKKITSAATEAGLPPPQLAAAPDDTSLPPEVTAGVSSKARMTASAAPPEGAEDDTEALGYAGSPRLKAGVGAPQNLTATEQEKPGGILDSLGIKMTPELRQGLMQAGLAMMATTRGGPGSFLGGLGEAGMAGVGAYSKSVEAQQAHDLQQAKMAMEEEHFQRPYKEMTAAQKAADEHRGEMTEYQKAELQKQKIDQAIKMRTPINLGTSISGAPIMGLPQIDAKGNIAIYPIDAHGNISTTPIQPGGTIKPSAEAVSNAAETWTPTSHDPGAPGSRNEAFLQEVKKDDAGQADAIRKAANYELDPAKYASMRKDQRQHFIDRVMQYDPNYNPQEVGLRYQAQRSFLPGTKNGDTITAFNTAISHLDTLKEMYGALKNGDVHVLNRLKNEFQTQFGYPAPNDVAALSSIIGGEVVKATVGAQNALGDREEVRQSISRDLSQMQADSVIDKYQKLMGGQLNARRFAYQQATGLHNFDDKFLLPRSQQVLKSIGSEGGQAAGNGAKPTPSDTDIAYARAHPEVKDKFIARFGVSP
jgi:hypothetical protein